MAMRLCDELQHRQRQWPAASLVKRAVSPAAVTILAPPGRIRLVASCVSVSAPAKRRKRSLLAAVPKLVMALVPVTATNNAPAAPISQVAAEAMAVSDRIAIMNNGRVQHAGTPVNIYHRPANVFVADFIGKANFLKRTLEPVGDRLVLPMTPGFHLDVTDLLTAVPPSGEVIVSLRPESLAVSLDGQGIQATIVDGTFLGSNIHYRGELSTGEHLEFVDVSDLETVMRPGTTVGLSVPVAKLNIFDAASEQSITAGVVNDADLG